MDGNFTATVSYRARTLAEARLVGWWEFGGTGTGWSAAELEWQQYAKDTKDIRLLEAFKEKHEADPVYVRLAEARIEEQKTLQAAVVTPPPQR